jgi:CheY-like chemotaxis protein
MLKETGATVVLVDDGRELVENLKTHQYDMVFCDINMPVMGGVEACEEIRKSNQQVPIFAFTANVMENDVEHYFEVGFTDIIPKPVIREELHRQLAFQCQNLTTSPI